ALCDNSAVKREFSLRGPLYQTGMLLTILSVLMYAICAPLMLLIPQNRADAPWVALLLSPFLVMGLYLTWHHVGRVEVTDDAVALHRLWWHKTIRYADVIVVREKDGGMPGGLVIRSARRRIRISRFIKDYPELYGVLHQRIEVMQRKEMITFPFEVRVRQRTILQNGLLVMILFGMMGGLTLVMAHSDVSAGALAFLNGMWFIAAAPVLYAALETKQPVRMRFTEGTIEAHYLRGEPRRWAASDLQKVELGVKQIRVSTGAGGMKVKGVRYPVQVVFKDEEKLVLSESRIGAFGYAPETLVGILNQLYKI
ncbi:MAG: hypothetical protein JXD18_01245, partial [Anaerolineae bacterium]|nr:hypothetical protein [Anaerolineae bacterium]